MDDVSEPFLTNVSGLVGLDTIRGLNDADIRGKLRSFSSTKVAILLPGVITSVQNPDTSNINHEHCSAQDMASSIAPEAYSIHFYCLVEIDDLKRK